MIVGINKPKGITSHDVIYRVRQITGVQRVGHAGTLDPLASGVLVVAIGRESTKQLSAIVQSQKEYLVTAKLDTTSETGDSEGPLCAVAVSDPPTRADVLRVLESCIGVIELVPPKFSAVKIKGVPAYKRARKKQSFSLAARPSHIVSISLLDYSWPTCTFRVVTGKGVYIRSLVEHVGTLLHVGGYVTALVRTRVGDTHIQNCVPLDQFATYWKSQSVEV